MGLQFFLLFLSYQDPIELDIAETKTALFNVKMASDLAISQILKRSFWLDFWHWDFFIFYFFLNDNTDTGTPFLAVDTLKDCTVFGKRKTRHCTFDMLFLNKVYDLVFFPGFCFIRLLTRQRLSGAISW